MKRYLPIVLILCTIYLPTLSAEVWRDETTGYEWSYTVNNGAATIENNYMCAITPKPMGELIVPEYVNGIQVKGIGYGALANCDKIVGVTIPDGLESISGYAFGSCYNLRDVKIAASVYRIGVGAFSGCDQVVDVTIPTSVLSLSDIFSYSACGKITNVCFVGTSGICKSMCSYCTSLVKVHIPEGVASIGDYAFSGCGSLRDIKFPSSLTSIGESSFLRCESLDTVFLPPNVSKIGAGAFSSCDSLSQFIVAEDNTNFSAVSGALYDQSVSTLIVCPASFEYLNIPQTVKSINAYAFSGCQKLKAICVDSANESYSSIDGVLYDKTHETLITCPQQKDTVRIADGVQYIANSAFRECGLLQTIQLPLTLKTIGSWSFGSCNSLNILNVPEGVVSCGTGAFANCLELKTISLPSTIMKIGESAFEGNLKLEAINVDDRNLNFTSLDGVVYDHDITTLIICPCGKKVVEIPDGVSKIGYPAFYKCTLQALYLPCGLKEVHSGAFSLTDQTLKRVYVERGYKDVARQMISDSGQWYYIDNYEFVEVERVNISGALCISSIWREHYDGYEARFGDDFAESLKKLTGKFDCSGNALCVWQDYVAGTDPTDETDVFKASITIVDGKVKVSSSPELDDARKALRKYTTWGKEKLTDKDWLVVGEGEEANFNFFKVTVEMR